MVNQAYENMGLASTQTIATLFDGMARHTPEGVWFKERAEEVGFKKAVAERDSGDPIPGSKKWTQRLWKPKRLFISTVAPVVSLIGAFLLSF